MSYYDPELNELSTIYNPPRNQIRFTNDIARLMTEDADSKLTPDEKAKRERDTNLLTKIQKDRVIKVFKNNDLYSGFTMEKIGRSSYTFTNKYFLAKDKDNNYIIGKLIQKNKFNKFHIFNIYANIVYDGENIKAIYNDDNKYYKSQLIGNISLEKWEKDSLEQLLKNFAESDAESDAKLAATSNTGGKKQRKSMKSKKSRKIKNKKSRKSYRK